MKTRTFKFAFIFVFLFLILAPFKVDAIPLCSTKIFNELKTKAYNVKFNYELKQNEEGDYYFSVSIANLTEELEVRYNGQTYSYSKDDPIIEMIPNFTGNKTYEFDIYVTYGHTCVGEKAYTKRLTLPKYNPFSELDECIEYEEFPLCSKWYKGNIPDYNYFTQKLNEYIDGLNKEDPGVPKDNRNIFQKLIDLYMDHLIISIPLTVVVVGAIAFLVVRNIIRRKNRVKIKF